MDNALSGRARLHIPQVDRLDISTREAIILHKTGGRLDSRVITGLLYEWRSFA
jgi:hypothetical protein